MNRASNEKRSNKENMAYLEDLTKWVTLAGAVVGGVTGALTYWSKATEKRDRIMVGFGPLTPSIAPGYALHVLSQSDHNMQLFDYGFIDRRGHLLSLPDMWANSDDDPGEGTWLHGKTLLEKRGDIWEVAYLRLRDEQIGVYAITVGQTWRRMDFHPSLPWYRRIYLWWKVWKGPAWQ